MVTLYFGVSLCRLRGVRSVRVTCLSLMRLLGTGKLCLSYAFHAHRPWLASEHRFGVPTTDCSMWKRLPFLIFPVTFPADTHFSYSLLHLSCTSVTPCRAKSCCHFCAGQIYPAFYETRWFVVLTIILHLSLSSASWIHSTPFWALTHGLFARAWFYGLRNWRPFFHLYL